MSIKKYYLEPNDNNISLFGKSFKWEDGDIVIDPKTKNPVMASGIDNLIQTVKRTLSIGRGTHAFYSHVGLSIRDIFEIQKDVSINDYYDYVAIIVQESILTSTPFYDLIRKIKVERSKTDERKLKVSIVLEAEQTKIEIELETDIISKGI